MTVDFVNENRRKLSTVRTEVLFPLQKVRRSVLAGQIEHRLNILFFFTKTVPVCLFNIGNCVDIITL
jgi:hypothetical protein